MSPIFQISYNPAPYYTDKIGQLGNPPHPITQKGAKTSCDRGTSTPRQIRRSDRQIDRPTPSRAPRSLLLQLHTHRQPHRHRTRRIRRRSTRILRLCLATLRVEALALAEWPWGLSSCDTRHVPAKECALE